MQEKKYNNYNINVALVFLLAKVQKCERTKVQKNKSDVRERGQFLGPFWRFQVMSETGRRKS